jgi:type 1 glutamine amidotransferase
MKQIHTKSAVIIMIAASIFLYCSCMKRSNDDLIKVLILSGRNNHEWQKTTPLIDKIYKDTRLFSVNITDIPDTLTYNELKKFDVVVSNWNTWPDNNMRLSKKWEDDFLRYVREGGGTVFIHAGASSFYGWNSYHQVGIGRWGKETKHGQQTIGKITGFVGNHPITKGLLDFYIFDELWEKTDIYPEAQPLASVTATDLKDGHLINEKAVFINQTAKGRSFYTTLGHNERALLNSGLQTLLLRATQWVAHRNVTIEPPADIRESTISGETKLNWEQSDTTLVLKNNSDKVWQFNFNNRFGKPYFHPLCVNNSVLTCAVPPDHPWHLGFWFSWKFINGVNYWEYMDNYKSEETGYRSAGITETVKCEINKNPDFSADIRMDLRYHPADSEAVMTEIRNIHISKPFNDGSYFIDHENVFSPIAEVVDLDRTPTEGEPDGKSWGGYAGLSIRFSQDYTSPVVIAPDENEKYKKNNWVYMGFNTLSGDTAGICILQDMKFTTSTTSWYIINNPDIPFFYYSPAVLFDGRIKLEKGKQLHLKYRIWIISGKTDKDKLDAKYDASVKN